MTTPITASAAAAREASRTSAGQFGTQPLSEADLDLGTAAGSAVKIDDAVRNLPIHRDDFQVFEPDAPLYSDSKATLLGAVAEHYAARGGATMRLVSPARHGSPAVAEVVAEDAEFGTTTAVFRVGGRLTLHSMKTAAGTDLAGHPGYTALTNIEGVSAGLDARGMAGIAEVELDPATELMLLHEVKDPDKRWQATRAVRPLAATGFGLTPTRIDEEGSQDIYDLRDGNRLEVQLSTGSQAYQVSREPGDDDGMDHYDHTRTWNSALAPRSQREVLDYTLSAYVFAEHLHRNGSGLGQMSYAGAEKTANAYGEVIDLPVHDSEEKLSVIRSGGRTSVTVLDEHGVDLIHYPDQYAEALQRITGRPDADPTQIAASIGAAADEVSRIHTESPDWSALRD
ncbi:hypothetical protein [Kocuria arenosa]|uniref:hypothetical protein n=1 Tax=Kocuria arenosa TaxID=3071446 RepID=UPI0034D665EC